MFCLIGGRCLHGSSQAKISAGMCKFGISGIHSSDGTDGIGEYPIEINVLRRILVEWMFFARRQHQRKDR
ncbi:hypothetical protein SDC9_163066 [bioreactor metagenome]|uniref:Uncharacterized protein n=1 Tax=bioreactor metagenome TaxID=1076179 RepID=A0A645FQ58_9ZZZZ